MSASAAGGVNPELRGSARDVRRCQRVKSGGAGDACVQDTDADGTLPAGVSLDGAVEEDGTYCDRSRGLHCARGTCVAQVAPGGACTSDQTCAVGSYCPSQKKVCTKVFVNGAACVGDDACASKSCAPGSLQQRRVVVRASKAL